MPGRSTPCFPPIRQTLLAPSAKRNVTCWASRMKGARAGWVRGGGTGGGAYCALPNTRPKKIERNPSKNETSDASNPDSAARTKEKRTAGGRAGGYRAYSRRPTSSSSPSSPSFGGILGEELRVLLFHSLPASFPWVSTVGLGERRSESPR